MLTFEETHSIVSAFSVFEELTGDILDQYDCGDGDFGYEGGGDCEHSRFQYGDGLIGDIFSGDSAPGFLFEGTGWGY